MTAPISNGPTTHGYTTMRDATHSESILARNSPGIPGKGAVVLVHIVRYADAFVFHPTTIFKAYYKKVCSHG